MGGVSEILHLAHARRLLSQILLEQLPELLGVLDQADDRSGPRQGRTTQPPAARRGALDQDPIRSPTGAQEDSAAARRAGVGGRGAWSIGSVRLRCF